MQERLNPYGWDLDSVEFQVACQLAYPPIGDATRYPAEYTTEREQFNHIYQWCQKYLAYQTHFHYHNIRKTPSSPTLHTQAHKNLTDSPIEVTADMGVLSETTDSFTWTMTSGYTVGVKVTGRVGVPDGVGGEIEVSAELNIERGMSSTKTRTVSIHGGATDTITVAPHHEVMFDATITNSRIDADFTMTVTVLPMIGAPPPPPIKMNYGTFPNTWASTFGDDPVQYVNAGRFVAAEGTDIEITITDKALPGA
jgi:hypothetical protein